MTILVQLRRALTAPGNLFAGAGAVLASAIAWNPLPLILYGLGEPIWLYRRATATPPAAPRTLAWHEQQLAYLTMATPAGAWMRHGKLPDYATTYTRLVHVRTEAERVVAAHRDEVAALEIDIVARMDDMLARYLALVRERLLFHCGLAKIYPQLPAPAAPPTWRDRLARALIRPAPAAPLAVWRDDTPFVSLDQACDDVKGKLFNFERESQREHAEVYRPMLDVLARRLDELAQRGTADRAMAAQLRVFPDQFELILGKLATSSVDASEIVNEMNLLLEQTHDTAILAEDLRSAEA